MSVANINSPLAFKLQRHLSLGYLINDADHRAVELYHHLHNQRLLVENTSQHRWSSSNRVIRDEITENLLIYLLTINASARQADPAFSEAVLERMPSRFLTIRQIENSLIDMWVTRC